MSFSTKFKMWWGTVKGNTEHFFGKETNRMVAHEYYDNPNAPSKRQRSVHTIASQSRRGSMGATDYAHGDQSFRRKSSDSSMDSRRDSAIAADDKGFAENYSEYPQGQQYDANYYPQEGQMPQDPSMMAYEQMQQQQWGGAYGNGQPDPNMMMYPQDPNMMNAGMYPQQPFPQDANMYS